MAVVPWANTGLSFFVKSLNTFLLLKVPYGIRFGVNALIMIVGLLGISFAPNFYVTILFILMTGLTSGFGESVALEHLQKFDSRLINAWGSGTGFASLSGGTLYILFTCVAFEATLNDPSIDNTERMKFMDDVAFWSCSPLPILYLLAYFVIIKKPNLHSEDPTEHSDEIIASQSSENSNQIIPQKCEIETNANETLKQSNYLTTYWKGFRATLWLSSNLSAVYLFEYLVRNIRR